MKEETPIHYHKVHHSLVEPAELRGIKLQWFGFLIAVGFILFPMTSGNFFGFLVLGIVLWAILTFVLRPLYRWDKGAIMVLMQAISQDKFHQPGDNINGPPKPTYESIPKPK